MNVPLRTTSTSPDQHFAAQLKLAGEASGMTQAAFASALGVSQQSVAKWESGAAAPRRHRQAAIEEVLGGEADATPVCGMIVFADMLGALVAAEQIIVTMAAQMTDEQKLAAMESTAAAGLPDDTGTRRRAAIAAARKEGAA